MKIKAMCSPRSNRAVPNQYHLEDDEGNEYFQSYETIIVKVQRNGRVILDPKWNCSVTTSKYRAEFLGENTRETEKKIASGEYVIQSLN